MVAAGGTVRRRPGAAVTSTGWDPDRPPPEVAAAMWPLPVGGGWEGGTVDNAGRRWVHQPWHGWTLAGTGRVYTAAAVRRRRRRENVVQLVVPAAGLGSLALICAGLLQVTLWWVVAGLLLAAATVALIRWGLFDGRPW